MKIGVCRGLDDLEGMKTAVQAGVDYWETGFGCLANFSDEDFNRGKEMLESLSLKCLASNGFIPGDMKLVGDNIDYSALCDYMDRGFERAKILGVKKIVLGSGKARSFRDGYSLEKAKEQISFCIFTQEERNLFLCSFRDGYSLEKAKEQISFFLSEYAAPKAKKAGCIIVLEPLRFCETSMIHTVKDGVEIARMCGCENVFGLADLYHVYGNEDNIEGIAEFKGEVCHAHIAEPVKRRYPSTADSDDIKEIYKSFFKALETAGCDTCSVEARTDDFDTDIFDAVKVIKSLI